MRPISLFVEKGSTGITVLRVPDPPNVACRIATWTSAEAPFVRTLASRGITITTQGAATKKGETNLGFCLVTAPEARSSVAFSLDIAAGTSRE
jgi:hypothetical protein